MQSEGEEGIEMGFSRFSGLERMRGSGGGGGDYVCVFWVNN